MNRITLAFAIAATLAAATAQAQTYTAPSSSQTPYLVPTAPGVETHSILRSATRSTPSQTARHTEWSAFRTASARTTTTTARSRC